MSSFTTSDGGAIVSGILPSGVGQALALDSSGNLKIAGSFSASVSDPSVGTNGSAIPTSSSLAGAKDGSGNLQPLQVDGSGNLKITGSISASNPSVGTDGSAIPTSSTLIGASDGTNLQQLLVESASNRNLRAALYNGANELAIDASGRITLVPNSSVNVAQIAGVAPGLDNTNELRVSNYVKSAAAGDTALTLGQSTKAGSLPVTLASDQGNLGVSGTITANIGTSGSLALESGGNLATLAGAVTSSKVQANIAQWGGAAPSNSNPVYSSLAVGSAVATYGSNPTQTAAAAADTLFNWGAGGTTPVNHIAIMNNTGANIFYAFDKTSVSGNGIYILTTGQIAFWDRAVTTLHLSSAAQQNFGTQSGITVEGFA